MVPAEEWPSPQVIEAVKLEGVAKGLGSVKVASTAERRSVGRGEAQAGGRQGCVGHSCGCDGEGRGAAQIMDGDGGAVGPRLGVGVGPRIR